MPSDRGPYPQPPGLLPPPGTQGPARKTVPETDTIFAHVHAARAEAAAEPDTLRISIDTKAKVKVGDFSRGGVARGPASVKAVDHDMAPGAVLVPLGILELHRGATPIHQPLFFFGRSKGTSDFIADGLERWWGERKMLHPGVRRLHIELDNGPEIASSRTQFMTRLVDFVDRHRVEVRLVYLPPYHSKYNPIERCWGGAGEPLERGAAEYGGGGPQVGREHDMAWSASPCSGNHHDLRTRRSADEGIVPPHRRAAGPIQNAAQVEPENPTQGRVEPF